MKLHPIYFKYHLLFYEFLLFMMDYLIQLIISRFILPCCDNNSGPSNVGAFS